MENDTVGAPTPGGIVQTRVPFPEAAQPGFSGRVTHLDREGESALLIIDVPLDADVSVGDDIVVTVASRLVRPVGVEERP